MGFTEPVAWMFASLALVLLYLFLRPERSVARIVPAVFLWPDLPPKRRRRWDPLLILQLLALLMLVATLAGPYLERPAPLLPERHVLVVDRTASMQASYRTGTRLDAAKEAVERYLSGLGPGDQAALVVVGEQAEVLVPFSHDLERLRHAVRTLAPFDSGGSLAHGLALARSLLGGSEASATVAVFSDFADPDLPRGLVDEALLFPVGGGDDNVAIADFAVIQRPWQTGFAAEVSLRVRNYGSKVKHGLVVIEWQGRVLLQRGFTLGPGETTGVVQQVPGGGAIAAKILTDDLLAVDNEASAWVSEPEPLQVCLISAQGSPWRELQALAEAAGNLRVTSRSCTGGQTHSDVYLFYRARPPEDFPHPALVVDPPGGSRQWPERVVRDVAVVAWDAHHPIFSGWTPAFPLPFNQVRAIEVPDNSSPFIWGRAADELVSVAWVSEGPPRQVWLAFDAAREPLLTSQGFPLAVFLLQSFAWLRPAQPLAAVWPVGQAHPLTVGSPAVVLLPSGEERALPLGTQSFVPHWRGRYELRGPKGQVSLHAVALDPRESAIAPRPPTGDRRSSVSSTQGAQRVPWGRAALIAAMLLLMFEAWLAAQVAPGQRP